MKSFDLVLQKIKPFGLFQWLISFAYGFAAEFVSPFALFFLMFLVFFGPEHHCRVPESLKSTAPSNLSEEALLKTLTPLSADAWPPGPDVCSMRDLSSIDWKYPSAMNVSELKSTACPLGSSYSRDKWSVSFTEKHNLICENGKEPTNILTISAAGAAVGTIFLSYCIDHFGRQTMLVFSFTWVVIWGIALIFMPNLAGVKAAAFFLGFQNRLAFPLPWVYCQEFSDIGHQAAIYMVMVIAFALGCVALAAVNHLATSWLTIVIWVVVLHGIMIIPSILVPESPRWQMTTGKVHKAKKTIRKMIKINKSALSDAEIDGVDKLLDMASAEELQNETKKYAFWTLYMNGWSLAIKVTIMTLCQIAAMLVYEGLTINLQNFKANPYLIFGIVSCVEIVAGVMVPIANYLGRVPVLFWSFLICGGFAIGTIFVNSVGNEGLLIFFVFMTKLSVTLAWDMLFMLMSELFPTVVRGTASGVSAVVSVIMTIAVPAIVYKGLTDFRIPMIVFAAFAFFGAVVSIFVPETAGLPLIDSLDEEKRRPVSCKAVWQNLSFYFLRNRRKIAAAQFDNSTDKDDDRY